MKLLRELSDLLNLIREGTHHIPAEFTKDLAHARTYNAGYKHGSEGGSAIDTTNMEKSLRAAYDAGFAEGRKTITPATSVRTDAAPSRASVGEAKLGSTEKLNAGDVVVAQDPSRSTYGERMEVKRVDGDKIYLGGDNFMTLPYERKFIQLVLRKAVGEATQSPHVKIISDGAAQGFNVSYKGRHLGHVFNRKGSWNAVDDGTKKKFEFLKNKDEAINKLLAHNNVSHPHSLHTHQAVAEASELHAVAADIEGEPEIIRPAKGGRTADQLELGDKVVITGHVNFKGEPGTVARFGKDKKFVVVKLDDGGEHSFHSSDVTEREAREQETVAPSEPTKFFLAFYDHDEERPWIGLVSKEHGGKWHEKPHKGKPEYRWGHSYEAFLSPDDIRATIGRSYPRSVEIEGPFYNAQEAEEHVAHNWGKLQEAVRSVSEGMPSKAKRLQKLYSDYDYALQSEDEELIERAIEALNKIKPFLSRRALEAINSGKTAEEFADKVLGLKEENLDEGQIKVSDRVKVIKPSKKDRVQTHGIAAHVGKTGRVVKTAMVSNHGGTSQFFVELDDGGLITPLCHEVKKIKEAEDLSKPLTFKQKKEIVANYKSWSGGWGPEEETLEEWRRYAHHSRTHGTEEQVLDFLKSLNEEVSDTHILALRDGSTIKGYFAGDDEDLVPEPKDAYRFKSKEDADEIAKDSNARWELNHGERFVAVPTTIVEANFQKTHKLVDINTGKVIKVGDKRKDFRGDEHTVNDWVPGHTEASTGRVYTDKGAFFPSVVDAKVVPVGDVKENSVYTNYSDWKQTIRLSFPAQAKDIKFRAKMEGEKTTVIASLGDKVFGEWDESTNEGKVLSETLDATFRIGDKVEGIAGKHKGEYGIVQDVLDDAYEVVWDSGTISEEPAGNLYG